jgi:hypothetical protein
VIVEECLLEITISGDKTSINIEPTDPKTYEDTDEWIPILKTKRTLNRSRSLSSNEAVKKVNFKAHNVKERSNY